MIQTIKKKKEQAVADLPDCEETGSAHSSLNGQQYFR